jgi:formate dehydrogenase subunit delta
MSPEKLAYMANQIGRFFAHQPHDKAVAATEEHLRKFWDPRMREAIVTALDSSDTELDPLVREAVERLRASSQTSTSSTVRARS